jgi:4-diphosphocytidyl-2-C-methyl-D-erythritol kinase
LPGGGKPAEIIAALRDGRNDMQAAAQEIAPIVGDVLRALDESGALLARMSGSGATCFGLFTDRDASRRTATALAQTHPAWWIRATTLR